MGSTQFKWARKAAVLEKYCTFVWRRELKKVSHKVSWTTNIMQWWLWPVIVPVWTLTPWNSASIERWNNRSGLNFCSGVHSKDYFSRQTKVMAFLFKMKTKKHVAYSTMDSLVMGPLGKFSWWTCYGVPPAPLNLVQRTVAASEIIPTRGRGNFAIFTKAMKLYMDEIKNFMRAATEVTTEIILKV